MCCCLFGCSQSSVKAEQLEGRWILVEYEQERPQEQWQYYGDEIAQITEYLDSGVFHFTLDTVPGGWYKARFTPNGMSFSSKTQWRVKEDSLLFDNFILPASGQFIILKLTYEELVFDQFSPDEEEAGSGSSRLTFHLERIKN